MNKIISISIISSFVFAIAPIRASADLANEKQINEDEDNYRRSGGYLYKPNSQRGEIVFVNCQNSAKDEWINDVVKYTSYATKFNISITNGTFTFPSVKLIGSASLYIIDDSAFPSLLAAPETPWAVINVAPLKCSKEVFFAARVKKELSRAFAYMCGGAGSQFSKSLVGPIPDLLALDRMPSYELPVDSIGRFKGHMKSFGVTPARYISYVNACKQGWAPAPTNDVQKAIWDDVHTIPKNPIQIKP